VQLRNFYCFFFNNIIRGVSGKEIYIKCRPIGKIFMLIMARLPSILILYLSAVLI